MHCPVNVGEMRAAKTAVMSAIPGLAAPGPNGGPSELARHPTVVRDLLVEKMGVPVAAFHDPKDPYAARSLAKLEVYTFLGAAITGLQSYMIEGNTPDVRGSRFRPEVAGRPHEEAHAPGLIDYNLLVERTTHIHDRGYDLFAAAEPWLEGTVSRFTDILTAYRSSPLPGLPEPLQNHLQRVLRGGGLTETLVGLRDLTAAQQYRQKKIPRQMSAEEVAQLMMKRETIMHDLSYLALKKAGLNIWYFTGPALRQASLSDLEGQLVSCQMADGQEATTFKPFRGTADLDDLWRLVFPGPQQEQRDPLTREIIGTAEELGGPTLSCPTFHVLPSFVHASIRDMRERGFLFSYHDRFV